MSDKQHSRSRHSTLVGNTVPFPGAAPSLSRQLSDLSLVDLGSLGYSYPTAYSRLTRDSIIYQHPRSGRHSSVGSAYSQRTRRLTQQLSPVVEENESRGTRSPTSLVAPWYPSVITPVNADDPFAEDITFAMMMMPSPRVEMRRSAAKKRRAEQSKVRATYHSAKRAAGATKRVVASVGRTIFCPPWQWAKP
ncbi:hypothetical protein FA95DRAFT_1602010 [Auriscalpium vulgare]|uniref:Uncharacterized protein n=1 Tax=Auriscalpium vulgare TaxID=40419 RepID=A0ACB8S877_9AGAM|nr:hypothetical protein FA95DRAFT_1602010 [Auriscalpium vulgare]